MERRKITKDEELNLIEPLIWHEKDGSLHNVKRFCGGIEFYVVEREGQCYVILNMQGYPSSRGLLFAIKERFDDLEGEEIKDTGGKTSETEE